MSLRRYAALAAVFLLLAGCGDAVVPQPADTATDRATDHATDPATPGDAARTPGPPRPTSIPAAEGEVLAQATVLEKDGGPQLCLGVVAASLPPQCGGPVITNWDWATVADHAERRAGTTWGTFAVSGTFDGTSFTLTQDPIPLALYDPPAPAPEPDPFATRCPEPDGGWQVLDPRTASNAALQRTLRRAKRLDGYGGAWLDQSVNPAAARLGDDQSVEGAMNDPRLLVLNVLTTADLTATERTLHETWGGMLCVSPARSTEAERRRIQRELTDLPGMLSSSAGLDRVELQVVWDDGSYQRWADAAYGDGTVVVTSALQPADG